MRKGDVVLLNDILKNVYNAKSVLDEKIMSLVASVPIDHDDFINFWLQNIDGHPVLMLNMPEILWGKGDKCYLQIINTLRWRSTRKSKVFKVDSGEFRGHTFRGWQPNVFYPIKVFVWNKKDWNEYKRNKLILGVLDQKEEKV